MKSSAWIISFFLVLVGVLVLLHLTGILSLGHWWALLILLPAMGLCDNAREIYHQKGDKMTRGVMGALNLSILLILLTFFLLQSRLGFGKIYIWAGVIILGLNMLIAAKLPK